MFIKLVDILMVILKCYEANINQLMLAQNDIWGWLGWVYQVNWNSDGYGFIGGKKLLATLANLEVIERCLEMPLATLSGQVQWGQNELHALSTPPKITMHSWKFRNQNLNKIQYMK